MIDYVIFEIDGDRYIGFPHMEKLGIKLMLSSSDLFLPGEDTAYRAKKLEAAYREFGTSKKEVFAGYQTHTSNIEIIPPGQTFPENSPFFGHEFSNRDGLISNQGYTLLTKFADCTPIVLFDPNKRVLTSLHSGWKGTSLKIGPKALSILKEGYGTRPEDLLVFIGPSIAGEDFEVADDLVAIFEESHGDISAYLEKQGTGKYLFDMPSLLKNDLISAGIPDENIFQTDLWTLKNPLLHSYRRDGVNSGRMYLMAKML